LTKVLIVEMWTANLLNFKKLKVQSVSNMGSNIKG